MPQYLSEGGRQFNRTHRIHPNDPIAKLDYYYVSKLAGGHQQEANSSCSSELELDRVGRISSPTSASSNSTLSSLAHSYSAKLIGLLRNQANPSQSNGSATLSSANSIKLDPCGPEIHHSLGLKKPLIGMSPSRAQQLEARLELTKQRMINQPNGKLFDNDGSSPLESSGFSDGTQMLSLANNLAPGLWQLDDQGRTMESPKRSLGRNPNLVTFARQSKPPTSVQDAINGGKSLGAAGPLAGGSPGKLAANQVQVAGGGFNRLKRRKITRNKRMMVVGGGQGGSDLGANQFMGLGNPYALSELFSQSEIPGFREIFASDSYLRKFCWIVAFLFMTVLSLNDMTELITEYYEYPITVDVRLRDSARLPFPAVTVCNLNAVRFSSLCSNSRFDLTSQIPSELRDKLCGIQVEKKKKTNNNNNNNGLDDSNGNSNSTSSQDTDIGDINNLGPTAATTVAPSITTTTSTTSSPTTSLPSASSTATAGAATPNPGGPQSSTSSSQPPPGGNMSSAGPPGAGSVAPDSVAGTKPQGTNGSATTSATNSHQQLQHDGELAIQARPGRRRLPARLAAQIVGRAASWPGPAGRRHNRSSRSIKLAQASPLNLQAGFASNGINEAELADLEHPFAPSRPRIRLARPAANEPKPPGRGWQAEELAQWQASGQQSKRTGQHPASSGRQPHKWAPADQLAPTSGALAGQPFNVPIAQRGPPLIPAGSPTGHGGGGGIGGGGSGFANTNSNSNNNNNNANNLALGGAGNTNQSTPFNNNNNLSGNNNNNFVPAALPDDFELTERQERELQESLTNWLAVMYQRDSKVTRSLGHQFDDMILRCTMKSINCTRQRSFEISFSPTEGNCFTYRSKIKRSSRASQNGAGGSHSGKLSLPGQDQGSGSTGGWEESNLAGTNEGLELVLNLEKNEYISGSSQVGALVMIHHPSDLGYAASEATFIAPEFTTYIGLKMVNITRLPAPYPEYCVDSWPAKFADTLTRNSTYSQQACLKICLQLTIQSHCSCQSAFLPIVEPAASPVQQQQQPATSNSTSDQQQQQQQQQQQNRVIICDTRKPATRQCVREVNLRTSDRVNNCECPPKCQVVRYDKTISMARWPTREDKVSFDRGKMDVNFQNLAKVIVYFQTMTCEEVSQQAVFNAAKLFSALGGIMGMYVGFSFLSVFEILEVVSRKFWHYCSVRLGETTSRFARTGNYFA